MSLEDIRSECSDTAALLQPYVDGELEATEQERVAGHLEACRPCRAAVQEQHWVRATLRAIQREPAPTALRARILGELDTIDAERIAEAGSSTAALVVADDATPARGRTKKHDAVPPTTWWSRAMASLADVARGGMVMVPASAVAVGLFFVAREGMVPVEPQATHLGAAITTHPVREHSSTPAPAVDRKTAPSPDAPLVAAPPRSPLAGDVQLVHARVAGQDAGASLHYEVLREGRPTGQRLVDHQGPAGTRAPSGIPVVFGGNRYLLDQTSGGDPVLHYEVGGVAHMVVLESAGRRPTPVPRGARADDLPDFSFLLDFADRNIRERAGAMP